MGKYIVGFNGDDVGFDSSWYSCNTTDQLTSKDFT
jgi:hypothetical protein